MRFSRLESWKQSGIRNRNIDEDGDHTRTLFDSLRSPTSAECSVLGQSNLSCKKPNAAIRIERRRFSIAQSHRRSRQTEEKRPLNAVWLPNQWIF